MTRDIPQLDMLDLAIVVMLADVRRTIFRISRYFFARRIVS